MSHGLVRYLQNCLNASLQLFFTVETPKNLKDAIFFMFPTLTGHSDLVDPTWGVPCESCRPDDSENVMVFHATMF